MLLESFALFYGILGSTATLKPYFDRIKSKLSIETTHEKIIFKCYRKALKDVTGEDWSRFRLKADVAILKQIDGYFSNDEIESASTYIGKFLSSLNIDFKEVQEKFESHLTESGSPQVLTHICLITMKGNQRIEQKLSEIVKKLEEIVQSKKTPRIEGIPAPPNPYFAHPYPLQENFTGRLSERKELTEWFTKGTQPMFAYVAIGGMGKSALTWYWLQEDIIKQGSAPEGIIWWSFYDREARFETFLEKSIKYVSKGDKDPKQIPGVRDKMETLYTFLCNNRFLIILDGVERVLRAYAGLGSPYKGDEVEEDKKQEFRMCIDPNVGNFLQWLASANVKTKTLLTSRLCPKEMDGIDGCVHVDLNELNKDDAVNFFHRQGVKGTRAEIESACVPFGYHPLSLRLLSGMIVKDPKYMGDVTAWTKYNPLPELKGKEKHNILEIAYNSLDTKKQILISKLSAFRNPMAYDSILIFNEFGIEGKFGDVLNEMVDRGLLLRNVEDKTYDLHPIIRKYCYDRLMNKIGVHSQLRDYFTTVPKPKKIESLDDLAAVIELYHHTVNSGKYDEAWELYRDRLWKTIYYRFGAYTTQIQLLETLFTSDKDGLPSLSQESYKAHVCNELASCYFMSGQPKKAISLSERHNVLRQKAGDKEDLAIGLVNLAHQQGATGDLEFAMFNLRTMIDLSKEIGQEAMEAVGHSEFGWLLSYQGKFGESEKELAKALEFFTKEYLLRSQSIVWVYHAIRAILMSDEKEALRAAKKGRELVDLKNLSDIIWAEWILGAAYVVKGDFKKAEDHLKEALIRDRKINLLYLEPDILLEFAKVRFKQGHKEEALKLANEALEIADRCEYRLKQADIHNFLAEFYLNAKEFSKAKEHMKIAKERTECGYVPAMKKAEGLEKRISQRIKP
jgi:tetratricopeptide (TPR) repeat protein